MTQHIRAFISYIFIFISVTTYADLPDLAFKRLSIINNMPTSEVRRLYQDKQGFLWIATTDGLCSYDGYQVKIYKSNMYTPGLLSNNNVRCVAEDNANHLFIGTNSGLNVLDKKQGIIRRLNHPEFSGNVITSILVTRKGEVYIGSDQELYRYHVKKDSLEICYTSDNRHIPLSQHLYEDSKGYVWAASFDGLFRLDFHNGRFLSYPSFGPFRSAHILLEDSFHRMWVGSYTSGLFVMNRPYDVTDPVIQSFTKDNANSKSLSDDVIYSLIEDRNNHTLWIGTRSGLSIGKLTSEGCDGVFQNYYPGSDQSMPFNEVNALLQDRQGTIWLGMLGGGVYSVDTGRYMFGLDSLDEVRRMLTSNSVRSMMINPDDGKLWLGIGSYGLVVQDRSRHTFTHYSQLEEFRHIGSMSTLNSIVRMRDGRILMGSFSNGYYEYEKGKPVKNYYTGNTSWLPTNRIFSIEEDASGICWFATMSGICRKSKSQVGEFLDKIVVDGRDVSCSSYQCILEEAPGVMWFGSSDEGLLRIEHASGTSDKFKYRLFNMKNDKLKANDVQCLFKDHLSNLWVGTDGGGLLLYDKKSDTFESINTLLRLPCDGIFSIEEDNQGKLWVGTNGGLLCLKPNVQDLKNCSFQLYTSVWGLQDDIFLRGSSVKTPDGELLFGGHQGYNYFHPQDIRRSIYPSVVNVTDFKIFNQSWDTLPLEERMEVSDLAPEFTDRIVLNHHQNNFSIEFSAMDFINPMQNKYSYKLSDFDADWQVTDASHRFAYYNNLRPGKYLFRLRVMDENGAWSADVRSIEIIIKPPFWATWWAYLLYLIILGVVTYFLLRSAKQRMMERNRIHLLEMENSKIEELNHAKLQFFTNITHELLTPLTIISATVDELKMQAPDHKSLYDILNTNIYRFQRLLQQILEFRKAETGNLKLRVSPGDIAAFVKNEAESFEPLIRKRKLHFSVLCNPDSLKGYYDSDKLDKIIYNLLSNAAKYNREGGFVQLTLSYAADQDFIELKVEDNGQGISPQRQKDLFKRFYDGDFRKFNTIGTGIGLSLTKDLVDIYGGQIRVESEVGRGTTFFVVLPISRNSFQPEQIDEEAIPVKHTISDIVEASAEEQVVPQEKAHSVLVIEDNDDLLEVMVKLLGRDYKVFQARNGLEGKDIIENEDVDIVVSDVMMPEMDGIEFTRFVKGNLDYCHIPIILLTAKTKEEDRAEAYESGADAFITKPFNLIVLHARIKNLLKSKERNAHDFKNQLVFEMKELNYTSMDEQFMQKAVDCVNRHLDDSGFDVPQFIDEMGTSKTTLYKKLKSLTGLSTSSFIRNIRLKAACRIMEENPSVRISDLAYEVGFNDPKYFSLCFKKEFGMLPSDYCERFSTNSAK